MPRYFCASAKLPEGWQSDVLIDVDGSGFIRSLSANSPCPADAVRLGTVIPAMANLHSHAFQRAMAGLGEIAGDSQDSFWTWREQMYQLVAKLTPEQVEAIASYLYMDLLQGGYTQVAEFNYLHHDPKGQPYSDDAMAQALRAAAFEAGIGQTLLPVLYSYSGFGSAPPLAHQRRFIQSTEQYLERFQRLYSDRQHPLAQVGLCFHSLRAVEICQIKAVLAATDNRLPVHIHISEQQKEVDDCQAWCGQRPLQYLYQQLEIDKRWCLVHATHVNLHELANIAQSQAVVGICPSTEANLGDGIFPATELLARGGRLGIGSDSHVSVSALEELRWLEYGQRLRDQRRNRLVSAAQPAVADNLWQQAAEGGAQACGVLMGSLAAGYRADWLVLKDSPWLAVAPGQRLGRWLFGGGDRHIDKVFVAGRCVVKNGEHPGFAKASARFATVMKAVLA
ncbi:formimidoylglutamate deiminase [Gallaecimonas mangrovi]|uniref:formimidoylglutamate deiminase n=1 Tax=Gallaecimonas mangrovi TaxID=2291597 RepID=UPI000E1FC90B|nr:formimidoylglutamate deiminase [Gallaecimonas mangrovi]